MILARVFYCISNQKRLRPVLKPNLIVEIETIPWCLTKCFANLELYFHLTTSFTFKLSVSKLNKFASSKNNSGQTVKIQYYRIYNCVQNCKNEHACVFRKLCQVMFCCRHFYRVRIEPHCKHRSIEFLTMQTDQSKGDILIDHVLR